MADINHEIVDGCAIFTAVTERGRDWMVQIYHEATRRYALNSDLEKSQAELFLKRAKDASLDISEPPN